MSCTPTRDRLAAYLYGDLEPAEAAEVETHVRNCPACGQEYASLKGVRQLLDAVPTPKATVDLPALYHRLNDDQARRLVRWRRATVVLGAVAALALLTVGLRLELRLEGHQLTVRWGTPAAAPEPVVIPPAVPIEVHRSGDEEQLQLLRDLVYALHRDIDSRDAQRQQELARVYGRLAALQRQTDLRWVQTEQNVTALYLLSRKGNEP